MQSEVSSTSYSKLLLKSRKYLLRSDFVSVLLSTFLSFAIRFGVADGEVINSTATALLIILLPFYWMLAMRIVGAWSISNLESRRNSIISLIRAGARATIYLGFTSYILHDSVSRLWLLYTFVFSIALMSLTRLILHSYFDRVYHSKISEKYILIARADDQINAADIPPRRSHAGSRTTYIRITPATEANAESWLEELRELVKRESVDGIIIARGAYINGVVLSEISKLYYLGITAVLFSTTVASELKLFRPIPHENWVRIQEPQIINSDLALKRIFDIVFSAIAMIVLSPILLLIALAIKLSSKGPVLFIDQRIGQNGKLFRFPKFRTMIEDANNHRAEIIGKPNEEIVDRYRKDPRITPIGRFLRRWSLDELPQFFCVFIGTMSVVGPRPVLKEELDLIDSKSEFRFLAKPGLTGLWQVNGRKEVTWEDRMAMDSAYIHNWTFAQDLTLIGSTIGAIFLGRGAY